MFHTTLVGVAVAVVVTVPALPISVSVCQAPGSIQSQVATPTSCSEPAGGAILIVADPSGSCWMVWSATTTGSTWPAPATGCALVTQIGGIGLVDRESVV